MELTLASGGKVWINVARTTSVGKATTLGQTRVALAFDVIYVTESVDEVIALMRKAIEE
jgi:hypothetical protein